MKKMIFGLLLSTTALFSCAEFTEYERIDRPYIRPRPTSYKFNTMSVSDAVQTINFYSDYYIEPGNLKWTITKNNLTETYSNFDVNSNVSFRGMVCTSHRLITVEDGNKYWSDLYICNEGLDVYQVLKLQTLHFHNTVTK